MNVNKMTKVDKSLSFEDRIAFLKYCADLYETNGTSPISDYEYDMEWAELEQIDPNHSFFEEVGGMDDEHIYGTKIQHKVICGSLLKDPDPETFEKSISSIYANNNLSNLRFILQYKIDGSSMCCVYDDGKLQNVITRGRDGWNGVDVTQNGEYIKGIPSTIPCKDNVEIRGECYKDRQDFYKKWYPQYKNPRNFTAGSINQKDPLVTKGRGLEFIAYEVVRKDFTTEKEKLQFIIDNGFANLGESTRTTKLGLTFKQLAQAVKIFMDGIDRPNLPFDIDGVVIKLDHIATAKAMGSVSGGKKPKSNRAVKFPCEQKETELIGTELSVGRTGAITIVGLLNPVELSGTTIQRVALCNFDNIKKQGFKIGCKVLLQKSGDIIPYIVKKTKDGHTDIEVPDVCPACGGDVEWDENNVTVHCQNDFCVAKLNRSIEHWFKKIGVLGLGKGIICKLTDTDELSWENEAIITCISDMYWKITNDRKTEHPFRKYAYLKSELGEKTYDNIVSSVNGVTEVTLSTFIEALGIGNIGTMSKNIVEIAPTIEDVDKLSVDDLMKLDKFAEKKSNGFVNGWKNNRKEIEILLKFVSIVEPKSNSNKLAGKTFCVTGTLSRKRNEVSADIESNGGVIKGSVGKDLDYLVAGEDAGGKEDKAKKLGVKIITEEELKNMMK